MLEDKKNELMSNLLFTVHQHGGDDVTWKPPIDSLVVSALQDAGGYAISRQNNLELHLGYHTCRMSYFTLVCLWCGRTVGRSVYGHVITKFSRFF